MDFINKNLTIKVCLELLEIIKNEFPKEKVRLSILELFSFIKSVGGNITDNMKDFVSLNFSININENIKNIINSEEININPENIIQNDEKGKIFIKNDKLYVLCKIHHNYAIFHVKDNETFLTCDEKYLFYLCFLILLFLQRKNCTDNEVLNKFIKEYDLFNYSCIPINTKN